MVSFIIFKTTVPESTPLSLLLVRWGSLFLSCFILYSPTTADIYSLFAYDPLQLILNTLQLFCTVRTEILYIFFLFIACSGWWSTPSQAWFIYALGIDFLSWL